MLLLSTMVLGLAGVVAEGAPSSPGAFDAFARHFPALFRRAPARVFNAPAGPSLVVTDGPTVGPFLLSPRKPPRVVCTMQVLAADPNLDRGIVQAAPPNIDPGILAKSGCDE